MIEIKITSRVIGPDLPATREHPAEPAELEWRCYINGEPVNLIDDTLHDDIEQWLWSLHDAKKN
jgi:hypothetical protein